jgi:predicted dehydrogenase
MSRHRFSRRQFLAAGMASPFVMAACAHGQGRTVPPSERINVGYIGVGRRAQQLLSLPPEAQIVAAADVNLKRVEEFVARYPDAKGFQDYREMLAMEELDAVVISSPDHWHALHSIDACKAGKDVYVEKPMTLTIREGRQMVEAAEKYGRIVQVGSQQRCDPQNLIPCELIRNGRIGHVHTVHASNYESPWECPLPEEPAPEHIDWDAWCGQTEPRGYHEELYLPRVRGHEAGWISYTPYSGGEMTGWGAHGLDQIQWALGMDESGPVEIWPELDLVPPHDGIHMGPTCEVRMRYANGTLLMLDGKGHGGGGIFEGEEGTIEIQRGSYTVSEGVNTSQPSGVRLYRASEKAFGTSRNDTAVNLSNWLYCIRTRETPIADVKVGHSSTTVCHLGNIARWVERPLRWDPVAERFIDDDEANSYLERPQRAPYQIEV